MAGIEDLDFNKINLNGKNESIDELLNIDNKQELMNRLKISESQETKFKLHEDFIAIWHFNNKAIRIINVQAILNRRTDFIMDVQNKKSYYNEMVDLSKNFIKEGDYLKFGGNPINSTNFELLNEILDKKVLPMKKKDGFIAHNNIESILVHCRKLNLLISDIPVEFYIPYYANDVSDIASLKNHFKNKVPIITPSSQRPNGYFNRSQVIDYKIYDNILVVRPSDLNKYIFWGEHFIMVLPDQQAGVGYARYWCQQLANYLELTMCWMIDDLVKKLSTYSDNKPVHWGDQMGLMERTMNEHKERIGLLSIKSFNKVETNPKASPPKIHLCQVFVLMNVKLLKENNIEYNRSLCHKEDVLLTIDTLDKGFLAIMYRNLYFTDKKNRETGAQSPITSTKVSNYSPINSGNITPTRTIKNEQSASPYNTPSRPNFYQ